MNALATTRLSSKGQVVIPEEIRIRLGLQPGTRFIVLAEGDMVLLKTLTVPSTESFRDLIRQAREAAALAGMTEEDIQETIQDLRKTQ
ncbi:MAG: AbrB/MazE/SpoVT family DNA-binding domain-containing protein [Calditrichaeota bacterium]|nr:AbrB/MazE/SpoVT family DNA-binding domain-containing protein [Calditrichota bacterium]